MAYNNGGFVRSIKQINILSSVALLVFALTALTTLGYTQQAVDLLTKYNWLPLTGSLAALVVAFMASDTRDPSYYHPAEMVLILGCVATLGLFGFVPEFETMVTDLDPWGRVVIFVANLIAGGLLAR